MLLIQPLKRQNFSLPNLEYQIKNKYPPLAKNFTNWRYHSVVTHVLYHFCDMSLITACAIFSSVKFYLVSTCTFFGDTICLHTNPKLTKIVAIILHLLTCIHAWRWHCFLVFNIWVSHALEMTISFYYPTLELLFFSFNKAFTHSKFCLPNRYLFGATRAINNDRSLNIIKNGRNDRKLWYLTFYLIYFLCLDLVYLVIYSTKPLKMDLPLSR
jgi:hypothetical protein